MILELRTSFFLLQATAQVLAIELPGAAGDSDLPGQVRIVAVEALEGSSSVEAVAEVAMCGLLLDKKTLGTSELMNIYGIIKIRPWRTNLDLAVTWRHRREYFYLKKADFV